MIVKKLKMTLLVGLTIILTACPMMPKKTEIQKPTRPTISFTHHNNGGVCIPSREDAKDLGLYILELEALFDY